MKTDNEVLAEFMGQPPEEEYVVSTLDEKASCLHPKHLGDYWPGEQKKICDDWVSKYGKDRYKTRRILNYPRYDSDFRQLMPVWYKFKKLDFSQIDTTFKDRVANAILHSGCAEASKLLAEGIRWYQSIKK